MFLSFLVRLVLSTCLLCIEIFLHVLLCTQGHTSELVNQLSSGRFQSKWIFEVHSLSVGQFWILVEVARKDHEGESYLKVLATKSSSATTFVCSFVMRGRNSR